MPGNPGNLAIQAIWQSGNPGNPGNGWLELPPVVYHTWWGRLCACQSMVVAG